MIQYRWVQILIYKKSIRKRGTNMARTTFSKKFKSAKVEATLLGFDANGESEQLEVELDFPFKSITNDQQAKRLVRTQYPEQEYLVSIRKIESYDMELALPIDDFILIGKLYQERKWLYDKVMEMVSKENEE